MGRAQERLRVALERVALAESFPQQQLPPPAPLRWRRGR